MEQSNEAHALSLAFALHTHSSDTPTAAEVIATAEAFLGFLNRQQV